MAVNDFPLPIAWFCDRVFGFFHRSEERLHCFQPINALFPERVEIGYLRGIEIHVALRIASDPAIKCGTLQGDNFLREFIHGIFSFLNRRATRHRETKRQEKDNPTNDFFHRVSFRYGALANRFSADTGRRC